jgi:succinate dehydrogenase / fumarate reductase cytochrome b subunit
MGCDKQGHDGIIMNQRPLSPHLQIWRWGPHMLVSILHRATGDGMAVVGLGVLVWWLGALAGGPEAYASFQGIMGSIPGMIVLVGLSWAFFTHMMSGLRHFVLDIGAGYELDTNRMWSIAAPVIAVVLTAAFWAVILTK